MVCATNATIDRTKQQNSAKESPITGYIKDPNSGLCFAKYHYMELGKGVNGLVCVPCESVVHLIDCK